MIILNITITNKPLIVKLWPIWEEYCLNSIGYPSVSYSVLFFELNFKLTNNLIKQNISETELIFDDNYYKHNLSFIEVYTNKIQSFCLDFLKMTWKTNDDDEQQHHHHHTSSNKINETDEEEYDPPYNPLIIDEDGQKQPPPPPPPHNDEIIRRRHRNSHLMTENIVYTKRPRRSLFKK